MDRRGFLKLMGLASGTSMLAGCNLDRNSEKLIPYLVPPEDGVIPGDATFVTSTCTECPASCSVSARIREERPVKVDGLVGHPVNDGALCVRGQASISRLYNPERIRQPLVQDGNGNLVEATWLQALARVAEAHGEGGRHLFLSGRTTGSYSRLVDDFCGRFGATRLPEFELFAYAAERAAYRELFGIDVVPFYHPEKADFLLTVGADVLETYQNPVALGSAISSRARDHEHYTWYHAEPAASMTGFKAHHRLNVRPGSEAHLLAYLIGEIRSRQVVTDRLLNQQLTAVPSVSASAVATATGIGAEELTGLRDALLAAKAPLVIAGGVSVASENGDEVAKLAALLQVVTGQIGSRVDLAQGTDYSRVGTLADLDGFADRLNRGGVGVVFIAETDPVGRMPEHRLRASLDKARVLVGIGDTLTETMKLCDVVLPTSHALESWGDAEPRAGVLNVIQPTFNPLFDTRSNGDVLLSVAAEIGSPIAATYQDYVMARWNREYGSARAQALVQNGYIETQIGSPRRTVQNGPRGRYRFANSEMPGGDVLVVAPSLRWYDGRSRDLDLLKEIPDPLSTVSWDAWVSVSDKTADKMGISDLSEVELSTGDWSIKLPVRRQPGLRENVWMVHRGIPGVTTGVESHGEASAIFAGINVRVVGERRFMTILSGSLTSEGRAPVPGEKPAHFGHGAVGGEHDSEHEAGHEHHDVSFNPEPNYPKYRWAMAVDVDLCVGCSACVAACYIENNVPMTGRDEHLKGREMSWIRIEPYYDEEHGGADFVPTMCQHCDYAPCEPVCPVYAAYHNDEGLNAQVYNRCVGTRYCANNCPYKQRRFNWFAWDKRPEPMNLMVNPDVSLRGKGIMEKCTFCVQRIRKARDIAKDENRDIMEGDFTTACAQACPGNAIAFGNLLDENSEIHKWASSHRALRLFDELGTSPGVYYLTNKKGNDHDA